MPSMRPRIWPLSYPQHSASTARPFDVIHARFTYPDGVAAVLLGRMLDVPGLDYGAGALAAMDPQPTRCTRSRHVWQHVCVPPTFV